MIARTSLLKCKNDASFVCEKGRYSVRKIKRVCYLQIRQSFLLRISPSVKGSFIIYGIRGTGGSGGGDGVAKNFGCVLRGSETFLTRRKRRGGYARRIFRGGG